MAFITRIEGLDRLRVNLRKRVKEAMDKGRPVVQVGFTQSYATPVHENLTAHHNVGQAKFLEEPARTLRPELKRILKAAYLKTRNMETALMLVGLRLQREAQLRTPVDTGALKASAYTALEKDAETVAAAAKVKSDAIRAAAKKGKGKRK